VRATNRRICISLLTAKHSTVPRLSVWQTRLSHSYRMQSRSRVRERKRIRKVTNDLRSHRGDQKPCPRRLNGHVALKGTPETQLSHGKRPHTIGELAAVYPHGPGTPIVKLTSCNHAMRGDRGHARPCESDRPLARTASRGQASRR
jgi:hypothetical protein